MQEEWLPGGFVLRSAPDVFPLGQDSILLGDFAACPKRGRALDLGSGAGVLALLLLAKCPELTVTALERSERALALLRENRDRNDLAARLQILAGDVCAHRALLPHGAFDYAVCNPPYFRIGAGKTHATVPEAREQTCDISEFVRAAAFALRFGGKCAFVYRPERLCSLLAAFEAAGLMPKRLRLIHRRASSAPSAVLLEGMKGAKEGLRILPPLLIEDAEGNFSDEYNQIYHL